jgi:NADH:ubiquinone oxidoreductase subunit F (NADH-binding)
VVIANGAEGEPLSFKDRLLMQARPHLVLDGALLAAGAVEADQIVLYIGREHSTAAEAMLHALAERPARERGRLRISCAPVAYVSGEETAAVQFVNRGVALPMSVPPRPFEAGVGERPTLVQNVESLAAAALIARRGGAWYRSSGTLLVTVTGAVAQPGVIETRLGTTVAEVLERAGGRPRSVQALLLGGYFGGWSQRTTPGSFPSTPCGYVPRVTRWAAGWWHPSRLTAAVSRRRPAS